MANDERRDASAPDGGSMQGGGYGGLQGNSGDGRSTEGGAGELQGGSYGRGWTGTAADAAGDADTSRPGYDREDVQIARRVQEALAGRPELDLDQLVVRSEGGVVTLSGTVVDDSLRQVALRAARTVEGIGEVRDAMRVRGGGGERLVAREVDDEGRDWAEGVEEDQGRSADRGSTAPGNGDAGDVGRDVTPP